MPIKKALLRLRIIRPLNVLAILFYLSFIYACSPKYTGSTPKQDGIVFSVKYPQARHVAIVGNFNRWEPDRDRMSGPDRNGYWTITLPLSKGRYEYLFLVDGKEWLPDPTAPSLDDGFGGKNSIVYIN